MSTVVRAKFKVISITRQKHWKPGEGEVHTVKLQPVTGGSSENERFYAATPGGSIELMTIRQQVGERFMLDGEYYVDFTPVNKEDPTNQSA